jgi:hypothetical protein
LFIGSDDSYEIEFVKISGHLHNIWWWVMEGHSLPSAPKIQRVNFGIYSNVFHYAIWWEIYFISTKEKNLSGDRFN